jgi:hypothetical protein
MVLVPNDDSTEVFIGIAIRLTDKSETSQVIRIPFHDFTERIKPSFTELKIFMKSNL